MCPLTVGHHDSMGKVSLERSEALVHELTCSLVFPGRPLDLLSPPILLVTCQSLYNVFSVPPSETAAETGEPRVASGPCLVAALNTYCAQMAWLSGVTLALGDVFQPPWDKHLPILSSYLLLALGTHTTLSLSLQLQRWGSPHTHTHLCADGDIPDPPLQPVSGGEWAPRLSPLCGRTGGVSAEWPPSPSL